MPISFLLKRSGCIRSSATTVVILSSRRLSSWWGRSRTLQPHTPPLETRAMMGTADGNELGGLVTPHGNDVFISFPVSHGHFPLPSLPPSLRLI